MNEATMSINDAIKAINGQSSDFGKQINILEQSGVLSDLEKLRKENRELECLINDASILITKATIPMMLDYIIDLFLQRFIPEYLVFLMERPRGGKISQYCFKNLKPSEELITYEDYKSLKEYFQDKPFLIRYSILKEQAWHNEKIESFKPELIIPMYGIGGVYGIAILGNKVVGDAYTDFEIMYVDKIIHFLAVGVQNGFHHQTSITDSKTGLYNLEYFMHRLDEEVARSQRHKTNSCLMIIDVDKFKTFNDSFGHLAGDAALEALAAFLKTSMRAEDAVARFGGEEFCILTTDCNEKEAMEVAERIRIGVSKLDIVFNGEHHRITISIGARMVYYLENIPTKVLLDEADKGLYISKGSGRNRSTLFRPGFLGRAMIARLAIEEKEQTR